MADYTSDRTGASIDLVLDDADAGNIGKSSTTVTADFNTFTIGGFAAGTTGGSNLPVNGNNVLLSMPSHVASGGGQIALFTDVTASPRMFFRVESGSTFGAYSECISTSNTGNFSFSTGAITTGRAAKFRIDNTTWEFRSDVTGNTTAYVFRNPNGAVGSITTSGTATAYNTSSDPRLKDFKSLPTDTVINTEFNKLFSCFRTFNWKNDLLGDLVWGFDAHACIDAKLDIGSEGEGSRDLALGEIYNTTPAEIDEDGNEIKPAIEHKVSPAGVDQSKAVPVLLAKIEQLERRLAAAGL